MTDPETTTWIVHATGQPTDAAVRALAQLLLASVDAEQETREADDGGDTR